jgi:phospholipid transport system transporter-binding protein
MSTPETAATGREGAARTFRLVVTAPGRFAVDGALTFATARRACELGERSFAGAAGDAVEIDCAGITASDSAGLAVLLEWLRIARRAGRKLRYTALPQGLMALARISEVDAMLERGA